jgi:hypothetical protein
MSPMSAEATVVRNYVDWLVKVPWKKRTNVKHDIAAAQKVLDEDHFGLEKVKERIVEYLAVTQRVKRLKGPILCLVGPPGVGKTSLGQSIARATNRKFVRMSLGGVRDEAEIRGKSTRCRWTSAATRRRRCSRCSTPSRTPRSPTITSRSTSTCPRSCSCAPRTPSTSPRRSSTAWK